MVIGQDEAYPDDLADDLRPNWTLVVLGTLALAAVSVGALAWPLAVISIALGALMIAGADVDARTCILPDTTPSRRWLAACWRRWSWSR